MNTYAYVLGNPIRFSDPLGLITGVDDAVIILGTAAAASAIAACQATNCGQQIWDAWDTLTGEPKHDEECARLQGEMRGLAQEINNRAEALLVDKCDQFNLAFDKPKWLT